MVILDGNINIWNMHKVKAPAIVSLKYKPNSNILLVQMESCERLSIVCWFNFIATEILISPLLGFTGPAAIRNATEKPRKPEIIFHFHNFQQKCFVWKIFWELKITTTVVKILLMFEFSGLGKLYFWPISSICVGRLFP